MYLFVMYVLILHNANYDRITKARKLANDDESSL